MGCYAGYRHIPSYMCLPKPSWIGFIETDEPSVYGSDAPYVKLLWPLVIFGRPLRQSHTDSQALRVEYCIVGIPYNTAI